MLQTPTQFSISELPKYIIFAVLTASFRGYPLQGKDVQFPENYKGLILHESVRPDNDKDDRKFYVVNTFDSFTYWNWNKTPSGDDKIIKALDWLEIAEAVSDSICKHDNFYDVYFLNDAFLVARTDRGIVIYCL